MTGTITPLYVMLLVKQHEILEQDTDIIHQDRVWEQDTNDGIMGVGDKII